MCIFRNSTTWAIGAEVRPCLSAPNKPDQHPFAVRAMLGMVAPVAVDKPSSGGPAKTASDPERPLIAATHGSAGRCSRLEPPRQARDAGRQGAGSGRGAPS